MNSVTARQILGYARTCLGLNEYLKRPNDGRSRPQIRAFDILWGLVIGQILRVTSYLGVEALIRSRARRSLAITRKFGDDTIRYFVARLSIDRLREALAATMRGAKRSKMLDGSSWIGFAVDGTTAGRCTKRACSFCHAVKDSDGRAHGFHHEMCMIAILGGPVPLPLDVEPYKEGDSEYEAGRRLLERTVENLGSRFGKYVVADAKFATAPFLHQAGDLGLRAITRLKANLPELSKAACARFEGMAPTRTFLHGSDRVEAWDADDFDPWENLRWDTVRVLRYRQHKKDGTIVEAYWLTDFAKDEIDTRNLYLLAKGRWGIENEGFNDAKTRHGFEHLPCHDDNAIVIHWLLIVLALIIERLFRERYLHRGCYPIRTAIDLCRELWLSLTASPRIDSS